MIIDDLLHSEDFQHIKRVVAVVAVILAVAIVVVAVEVLMLTAMLVTVVVPGSNLGFRAHWAQ